jgi:AcrR family transcriptional regulator
VSTKEAILEAASTLFANAGYRGTTIAAVAEKVGISDAGVLHHFKTKEALLLAVLQEYGRSVDAGIAASGVHGIELLRLVREWGAGMEARPEVSALLIALTTEYLTGDAPARRALQASYRHGLDRYVAAFATAAANGDLRRDLDPVAEASALIAHMDGIRLQWFLLDQSFSMADSVRRYVDAVLERLRP